LKSSILECYQTSHPWKNISKNQILRSRL